MQFLVGVAAVVVLCSSTLCGSEGWQAGLAKVKITPTEPMPMAGYAARGAQHATGTLNDLWAKALLLEDAQGHRGLLVTLDLCGIDRQLSALICQRLSTTIGLRREQITLAVSHTHSGPVVAKNLRPMHYMMFDESDQKLVDDYAATLIEKITLCAMQARENRRPSRLSYASGQVTFATNRRNNPADEVEQRRRAGTLVGPVDYSLPVLAIHQENRLAATVFGYACHCTTLSGMEWSSDYAGFAQDQIEKAQPGCMAMFWAGCGADQNPLPRRTVDLAQAYGLQLADGVLETLRGVLRHIEPELSTQLQTIELPFARLPTEQQLESDSQSQDRYIAARAKYLLSQVRGGQPLQATYPYPIGTWKLGKRLGWISLGGEVVVDYALAIKALTDPADDRWVMSYANDVMAYIPSRRVLAEGGYEGGGAMVYYGLPTVWAPEIETLILDQVSRQLASAPAQQIAIFPENAQPLLVQDNGAGEGPLWHAQLGLLTSGDGHVMRRSQDGEQSIFLKDAGTNGLGLDAQGRLVMCQNIARQVSRRELDGSLTVLTDRFEGHRYNQPNDLTFDSRGRIYFTDPQYGPRESMELLDPAGKPIEGVYRIDLDGTVSRIITHEVDRPNGIAISADDRYLFVADNNNNTLNGARKLWRFDLTSAGQIKTGSQRLLHDWKTTRGPDGIELDQAGRVYVAAGLNRQNPPYEVQETATAGVYVFSPEGELLDFAPVPRDECTNLVFGGDDRKTLYVTAGGTLWRMPTLTPGK